MKKILSIILVAILAIGALTACTKVKKENEDTTIPPKNTKGNLISFKTTDLKGNEVTQDIFKDYELTMVNLWATWCSACVGEMPALAELKEKLPENTNLITICENGEDENKLAKQIVADSKGTYTTLTASDSIRESLLNNIQAYPTTIFVDNKGNIVGNAIEGTPGEPIVDQYLSKINDILNGTDTENSSTENTSSGSGLTKAEIDKYVKDGKLTPEEGKKLLDIEQKINSLISKTCTESDENKLKELYKQTDKLINDNTALYGKIDIHWSINEEPYKTNEQTSQNIEENENKVSTKGIGTKNEQ